MCRRGAGELTLLTMKKPETDEELKTELLALVNYIAKHYENPECWPLAHDEQLQFVRHMMYNAKLIKNSEPFLRAQVTEAARELALGT